MKNQSGFTLIELLVVIAIIGILSSVVLGSLNVARGRGADAKVKAQLASARQAGEQYYDDNGNYIGSVAGSVANDCTTADSMFQDPLLEPYTNLNNYPVSTTMRCSSNSSEFMISASLSNPGDFWCVDSSGAARLVTAVDHATAHPDDDTTCN